MPRQESRSRTVREEAPLTEDRPVQIQSQKRFFSNRGSDSANRTAKAIIGAVGAGTDLKQHLMVKADDEGRERAVQEAASGDWQDQQDENAGYMSAWAKMDAEKELGRLREGLPKYLESIDAHTLDEQEFVDAIDSWVQPQLEGIDKTGTYGRAMAPGVLQIYESAVTVHKDRKLAEIKAEQQEDIAETAQGRYTLNGGTWDHDYVAAQTHWFSNPEDSKRAYWTQTFAGAMFNNDVSILDDSLDRFPDGSSTSKNDPAFREEFETMRQKVLAKTAKQLKIDQDALKIQNDRQIVDLQVAIYEKERMGLDSSAERAMLIANPEVTFDQITSAENQGQSQFNTDNTLKENIIYTEMIWKGIHTGEIAIEDIFRYQEAGYLGGGTHGNELANSMIGAIQTRAKSSEAQDTAEATQYRNILNKNYNPSKGALIPDDPFLARINIEANLMFTELLSQGIPPQEVYSQVTQKFEPIVAAQPKISTEHLTEETFSTQARFAADLITTPDLKKVLGGEMDINRYAGVPKSTWLLRLGELYDDGNGEFTLQEISDLVQARQ